MIEYRFDEGKLERLPALAAELVALEVDVILAGNTAAALAAKQATRTLPIVFAGLPMQLERARHQPCAAGRQCHRVVLLAPELVGKRLELLKQAVPGVSRVAASGSQVPGRKARTRKC